MVIPISQIRNRGSERLGIVPMVIRLVNAEPGFEPWQSGLQSLSLNQCKISLEIVSVTVNQLLVRALILPSLRAFVHSVNIYWLPTTFQAFISLGPGDKRATLARKFCPHGGACVPVEETDTRNKLITKASWDFMVDKIMPTSKDVLWIYDLTWGLCRCNWRSWDGVINPDYTKALLRDRQEHQS